MNALIKTAGAAFKAELTARRSQFMVALPSHIPVERFERTCLVAVQRNPDLLNANPQSLILACQRAAQDGLLPDARDGAIVMFKGQAQWMPMVAGLMKLARNSGEIASINAHIAYRGEKFMVVLGDDERIEHERSLELADNAEPIAVYAIARLKNGEIVREVLTKADIEKIRSVSRTKDSGPWVTWWSEMAKKSAIRRLAKRLPLSSDRDADARLQNAVEASPEGDYIDGTVATPEMVEVGGSKLDALEGQIVEDAV